MQGVALAEEFARAKAPMRGDFFGDTLVGPTILQWGTEEQKKEFLPGILQGRTRGARASPSPTPVPTWRRSRPPLSSTATSGSSTARRSGPPRVTTPTTASCSPAPILTSPKHAGISYLLVPMRQDGIEVRGITQPDGTAEFCEVFFADARCPKDAVVGGVNNGWKVANSTLAFERGQSATTGYRRFAEEYRLMVEAATRTERSTTRASGSG